MEIIIDLIFFNSLPMQVIILKFQSICPVYFKKNYVRTESPQHNMYGFANTILTPVQFWFPKINFSSCPFKVESAQ